jgi:tRNA A37 threonylcarbamoyladenosine synthetase subunit TsaC/SUA5/YrdC
MMHKRSSKFSKGGIAIIASNVGYGIVATNPEALHRIFNAKKRQPHKRHAMIGSYDLHRTIHDLPAREAEMVTRLTVDLDLTVGVVASYHPDHPIMMKIPQDLLEQSSIEGTMAILVNGGKLQEELAKLAINAELSLLGSSANLTGKGTKVTVEEIEPEIKAAADIIIDYGRQKYSHPRSSSTTINFNDLRVLRFGACYDVIQDVFFPFLRYPSAG